MIVEKKLGVDVVTAARQRIRDTFKKNRPVWLAFSGGKDSIVLADIVLNMAINGEIDKDLLTVLFIDEEAMYDEVIDIVKQWRIRFLEQGIKFEWYCVQVKHFNCLNSMADEESFICWDNNKRDLWVREKPKFAISDDEWLIPYKDNYQSYQSRKTAAFNAISMQGLRIAESIQRRKAISKIKVNKYRAYPIYDMTDKDIWLYIKKYDIEIPKVYENLYRIGTPTNKLRISQFFSIDTAKSLVSLGEMYPDLMERVTKREPNAYLCSLYWDTEMFGKRTRKRRQLEGNKNIDYKKEVIKIINTNDGRFTNEKIKLKSIIGRFALLFDEKDWETCYTIVTVGDPKNRMVRVLIQHVFGKEKTK